MSLGLSFAPGRRLEGLLQRAEGLLTESNGRLAEGESSDGCCPCVPGTSPAARLRGWPRARRRRMPWGVTTYAGCTVSAVIPIVAHRRGDGLRSPIQRERGAEGGVRRRDVAPRASFFAQIGSKLRWNR